MLVLASAILLLLLKNKVSEGFLSGADTASLIIGIVLPVLFIGFALIAWWAYHN